MSGLTVLKVGGNEVDDARWTAQLAHAVASAREGLILVHGGGKEVSDVQRVLGAEPEWREGLRVTTEAALRAVQMVLSGVVNKRLTAALIGAGVPAAGISGEDGPVLEAVPAQGGRLGRTGEISRVHPELLRKLLRSGITPVLSPVSRGPEGGALNVNADDAAAAVAGAVAERFLLISNVPGVLAQGGETLPIVSASDLDELIAAGVVSGGMIPKLRAALRAAAAGVAEVRIGNLELLSEPDAGTRIVVSSTARSAAS